MNEESNLPVAVQHADDVYESLRAICHLNGDYPAPLAYEVLGNLKMAGSALSTVCERLSSGLQRSLDNYDVYDDAGKDPVMSVADARKHLERASLLAQELATALGQAQTAINTQGYHPANV